MKKLIKIIGIVLLLILILDFMTLSSEEEQIVADYNSMYSDTTSHYSKSDFLLYSAKVNEIVEQQRSETVEEGFSGQSLANAAIEEYNWYITSYQDDNGLKTGGRYYYYWFDLIPTLLSTGDFIDNYLPIGSTDQAANWYFYTPGKQTTWHAWCAIFTSCMLEKYGGIKKGVAAKSAECNALFAANVALGAQGYLLESGRICTEGNASSFFEDLKTRNSLTQKQELVNAKVHIVKEYEPKPGDLIFFRWNTSGHSAVKLDHVGIVVDYNSVTKEVDVVEGNNGSNPSLSAALKPMSSKVTRTKYNWNEAKIAAYLSLY